MDKKEISIITAKFEGFINRDCSSSITNVNILLNLKTLKWTKKYT